MTAPPRTKPQPNKDQGRRVARQQIREWLSHAEIRWSRKQIERVVNKYYGTSIHSRMSLADFVMDEVRQTIPAQWHSVKQELRAAIWYSDKTGIKAVLHAEFGDPEERERLLNRMMTLMHTQT